MFNQTQSYNHKVKLSSQVVYFKPWTTKNEKDYLILKESLPEGETITEQDLYECLIEPCIKPQSKKIVLDDIDKKMLMIEIRKISIGDTFQIERLCKNPKCGQYLEFDVKLSDVVKFKARTLKKITSQQCEIELQKPRSTKRIDEAKTKVEKAYVEFILSVKGVDFNGEYNNTFTFDECYEFINSLPSKEFDELYDQFKEQKGSLHISGDFKCIFCGEEHNIEFSSIPNFLWT